MDAGLSTLDIWKLVISASFTKDNECNMQLDGVYVSIFTRFSFFCWAKAPQEGEYFAFQYFFCNYLKKPSTLQLKIFLISSMHQDHNDTKKYF